MGAARRTATMGAALDPGRAQRCPEPTVARALACVAGLAERPVRTPAATERWALGGWPSRARRVRAGAPAGMKPFFSSRVAVGRATAPCLGSSVPLERLYGSILYEGGAAPTARAKYLGQAGPALD